MDLKIKIQGLLLAVQLVLQGTNAWTALVNISATGVNYGLKINTAMTENSGAAPNYMMDFGDGNVDFGIMTSATAPADIGRDYSAYGRYDIVVFFGNADDFWFEVHLDFYIGDFITELDVSNQSSEIATTALTPGNVLVNMGMATGTDVEVSATILSNGKSKPFKGLFNGSNTLVIEPTYFNGVDEYVVKLLVSNPLTPTPHVKHAVIEYTQTISGVNTVIEGYSVPITLIVGVQFTVKTTLTSGHGVTIAYVFQKVGQTKPIGVYGYYCDGLLRTHMFNHTFLDGTPTGQYKLTVEFTNFVSYISRQFLFNLYYTVNNFAVPKTNFVELFPIPIYFNITVASLDVKMGMGIVKCYIDFGDGTNFVPSFNLTASSLTADIVKTVMHIYFVGSYTCTVKCTNGIPLVLPDPSITGLFQEFTLFMKQINQVKNIEFIHDSTNTTAHSFSQPILMTIRLNPSLRGSLPLADISCQFDFGDTNAYLESERIRTVIGNVTSTETISTTKSFSKADTTFYVNVNCSNELTNQVLGPFSFTVKNECWSKSTFFDSAFKNMSTPRILKTNERFKLAGDVQFTGTCASPYFITWTWYLNGNVFHKVNTTSTVYVQAPDTREPNIYRIELSVTYINPVARMSDINYVQYVLPDLVCSIESAGSSTGITHTQQSALPMVIDASGSSDPANNLASIAAITSIKVWTCKTGASLTSTAVDSFFDGNALPADLTDCSTVFAGNNNLEKYSFNANTFTPDRWYLFGMTMTKGTRNCTKHQAINVLVGEPIKAEIVPLTNCLAPDFKLTFDDLQLNVAILDTTIRNESVSYRWSYFVLSPNTLIYENATHEISNARSTGLKVNGSALSNRFKGYAKSGVTVTAQIKVAVSHAGYATTEIVRYCYLNLEPYGGWVNNRTNDGSALTAITASKTDMVVYWSGWRHNNVNKDRGSADTGSELVYSVYQVFLNDKGAVNNTHLSRFIYQGVDTSCVFKFIGSKNTKLMTRLRFEVRHNKYTSPAYIVEYDFLVNPLFTDTASVTVSNVLDLSSSVLASVTTDGDLNNVAVVAAVIEQLDALGSLEFEEHNPEAELSDMLSAAEDSGDSDITSSQVTVVDTAAAVNSFMSPPAISPVLQKIQETMELASDALFKSVESAAESNPASLTDPATSIKLLSSVNAIIANAAQVTPETLSKTVSVTRRQAEILVNMSMDPAITVSEKKEMQKQILETFTKQSNAAIPTTNIGLKVFHDISEARMSEENRAEFLASDQLKARENSNLGTDVRSFLAMKNSQRAQLERDKRKKQAQETQNQIDIVTDAMFLSTNLADETSEVIGKPGLSVKLQKSMAASLVDNPVTSESADIKFPCLKNQHNVMAKVMVSDQKSNLLVDDNAGDVTSNVVTVRLGTTVPVTGSVTVNHKIDRVSYKDHIPLITEEDASKLDYHKFLKEKMLDDLHMTFQVKSPRVKCYVVWVAGPGTGTVSKINYIAKAEACKDNNYTIFVPTTKKGVYSVGIETIFHETADVAADDADATQEVNRRIRAAEAEPDNLSFGFAMATMSCVTWQNESWTKEGCTGRWRPNINELECDCEVQTLMRFANTHTVPINKIDFGSGFLKFSPLNQAAVMAVLGIIFVTYILVVLWARRQDKHDLLKWGITPLCDNFAEDNYFYVLKVSTGLRPGAGTRSRVSMVMAGEEMDTGVREIYDGVRKEFRTGSVMNFLMSTHTYLGDLNFIRIWHDNSGGSRHASWYLSKIEVQDVQRNETFVFLAERWLAIDKDDGHLKCVLPLCKSENLNVFKNRFFVNAKANLAESHMWISVVYRPISSNFTRVQRASCALAFIMLTMIANAMFFKSSEAENYETPADVQVGPFRFSLKQIYVSVICALITTPPTILLIYLFKLSKPRPETHDKPLEKDPEKLSGCKVPVISSWLEKKRLKSIKLQKHMVEKGYPKLAGCQLPYWCRYIAWFLMFAAVFLCAFFIMLYSMEWGRQKSEEWLTTFLLSFFESVFCLDPIKVAFMAVILAILFRSTQESDNIIDRSTIMKKYTANLKGNAGGIRLPAPPLDRDLLAEAKVTRQRELKMRTAFRDVMLNAFLIWILFSISYNQRDEMSFRMHEDIVQKLLNPQEEDLPKFDDIKSESDFFNWLKNTAIERMFPEKDVNGEELKWRLKQFTKGFTKYRLGPPRLRQLRTKKDSCTIPYFGTVPCYDKYYQPVEDTSSYCIGWKSGPCDPIENVYKYTSDAWKFTSALDIWGFPISGLYTTYGGGGYIAKLSVNKDVSLSLVNELYNNSWIDRQTRAVFFESTLYCINKNLFSYNLMIVEFPETGGAFPYYLILPLRLYTHLGPEGMYTLGCEIIFAIYLLVYTIITIMDIVKQKLAYFKKFWQMLDFLFVVTSYTAIIMYGVRQVFANKALAIFEEDRKAFVNFFHIALWDQAFVMLLGMMVFLITIRTLNILGYNKRINAVAEVLSGAADQLIWFGVFFFFLFTIYAMFGYLLFGSKLKSYMNLYTTMGTLFITMIGNSKFTEIEESDPIMAKIYFIVFIFSVVYIILTMFMAVLCKSIDQVHAETKEDKGDEMVNYLIHKCKGILAYGAPDPAKYRKPSGKQPPAPWTIYTKKSRLSEVNSRTILQDLRTSLSEIAVGTRELKTPVEKKPVVKYRK